MALALFLTAGVAVGLGYGLEAWLGRVNISQQVETNVLIVYLIALIASFIGCLILGFVMRKVLASGRHSIWVPYLLYAGLMGVMLSTLVFICEPWVLAEALGIASIVFLAMFLIGYFSKINLNPLGMVALGLLFAVLLLSLFWVLFYFLWTPGQYFVFDLVVSLILVGVLLIIAAVDAYNIKNILASGDANNNVCLYCAFIMYSDFVVILVRIVYLLSLLKGGRK